MVKSRSSDHTTAADGANADDAAQVDEVAEVDDDAGAAAPKAADTPRSQPSSKAAARTAASDRQTAEAIRLIDSTERKIGYAGAAVAAVLGLISFVPFIEDPKKKVDLTASLSHKKCPSGYHEVVTNGTKSCSEMVTFSQGHWILELVIVLAFALLIAVATRIGKRSFLAFGLLFGGLAVESLAGSPLALGLVVAGGWLMVRAYRVQKYGTTSAKEVAQITSERRATARAEKGGSKAPAPKAGGRSAANGKATAKTAAKGKTAVATAPDGRGKPEANKRYTPKAPPRKRPVPPPSS